MERITSVHVDAMLTPLSVQLQRVGLIGEGDTLQVERGSAAYARHWTLLVRGANGSAAPIRGIPSRLGVTAREARATLETISETLAAVAR